MLLNRLRSFEKLLRPPSLLSNPFIFPCSHSLFSFKQHLHATSCTTDLNPEFDLSSFPPEYIRNFSIIAHIDHGKSTLADRLLELTGTISSSLKNKQVLDKLEVERERGITVKAQSVSMFYDYQGKKYLLNLIDTPGHVDFSYEVSRSLLACQGALLLVDASQGIQAQTVANFYLAFSQNLSILPVLNKIDLPTAEPSRVLKQINSTLELPTEHLICISAKSGLNCKEVLDSVIENVPPPPEASAKDILHCLLFDSWYDTYLGVICLFYIFKGKLAKGDKIYSCHTSKKYDVIDVGILNPDRKPVSALFPGQVGYATLGMKVTTEAHIGDSYTTLGKSITPFTDFRPAKSMVFSGIFPLSAEDFPKLSDSISKLVINDASVSINKESSTALGQGFRLGFLGTLHMDVFRQRLEQEYGANVICTPPTVPFCITYKKGEVKYIRNPSEFPEGADLFNAIKIEEPMILATIIMPDLYLGPVITLCNSRRGKEKELTYIEDSRVLLRFILPMMEIVTNFYDELKQLTSGFASFDYEPHGYATSSLHKLNVLLNGKPVDAFATIRHDSCLESVARSTVLKLKQSLDRQLYEVIIQCAVGGKVLARETLPAMRKDVTAKCYGGDVTRKRKLLEKQKKGKQNMRSFANIDVSQEVFLKMLKN
ncbi:Translation factor guf1 mitochondrial [Coelomomyces lativittatus]|nr:Translation factor guf1 mitochondrial [Coelomomyces lativittatus]KAJ1517552.1 Translation factor guf1 mitochondrial [Coelomomyces lativittatus]